MRLASLTLENYRNIAAASLVPGPELTVICGNNGQGKTNLLEAVWLLTGGKSFRGGKDAELIRRDAPFAALEAVTAADNGKENQIRLTVGAAGTERPGRYAVWNGAAPRRASSLAGSFPAVVFDPGHLSLVKGPPTAGGGFWMRPCASSTPGTWPFTAGTPGFCSRKTACFGIRRPSRNGPGRKSWICWTCSIWN